MAEFDVLICGGGLVGLTLANALRDSGLSIAVVDAAARPGRQVQKKRELKQHDLVSGYEPRVSALNIASIRLLSRLGIWQNVGRACAFKKMSVRDSRGSASIEFDASEIHQQALGYIVENVEVLNALAGRLESSTSTLYWEAKVDSVQPTGSGYDVTVLDGKTDGEQIKCRLLVGADGGNSRIRTLTGMRTVQWRYGQEALVSTVQVQNEHENVARQWFTEEGPLAFLPLQDSDLCSVVWSVADASQKMALDRQEFCHQLTQASEGELGEILGSDSRYCFPLVQQHSLRYVKANLALIGDAAHTIHPLAGQGANLGFADAGALALELLQSKFNDKQVGDFDLLRRYEASRMPHNLLVTSTMELFKRLYSSGDPGINWLRNAGMSFANSNAPLKSMILRLASGL